MSTNPPKLHSPNQAAGGYEVGYGKPPAATQFKSGRSGNPRGRPKGAKNKRPKLNEERLKSIIIEEAYRTIKVNEGEKKVAIPMAQAIVRALAVNAAKGQHRSLQLFTEMLTLTERENKASYDEYLKTMIEYKCGWEQAIDHCRSRGLPLPDPLPHPDDIIINMNTGEVIVRGPWTKEDKVNWDWLAKRRDSCDEEIREVRKLVADPESAEYRHLLEKDLAFEEKLRERITSSIGEWPHNRGKPLE